MPVGRSAKKVRKRDQELSGRIYEALGSDLAAALCSPQKTGHLLTNDTNLNTYSMPEKQYAERVRSF